MFWLRMSAATIFFTAPLPHCPTAPLPHCPTAPLPYCPTALCSRTASPNASKILREGASDWTQYSGCH
ncbi:hypothetical protein ADS42_015765 [Brucella melitensis]|nr:hypothetical protein ADS42_015765 [Brucella melitensis]